MIFKPLLIGVFLFSCIHSFAQDNHVIDRVEASARNWILNKTLEVPASYKGEEFYDFEEVIDLSPQADAAYREWLDLEYQVFNDLLSDSTRQSIPDSVKIQAASLEERYNGFEKEHIGYKIKHNFRAQNRVGETLFYEAEFIMDKDFGILETSMKERLKSKQKTG